ncbi:UDP-N-acetylglucosamine 2-epimerase (non-hydrolyzing) [Endozoicomonas sp. G2_2]|uniref:non-hydrolyzing UDP-N-acetylglucosamine 2-epimerase n=1 Tax=Endozoicomonas sp. G2_2 TaxID=2821092 RepID=UPI001ADBDC8C|nr:UDP-N-acetylglucosamine 2-epimerase (non-hydrolyzing) [Endozoicomonas sp. G2_2]MBO9470144.1 UDP-N-acetylglucosamine 2-epimerase (non-hydrolyzing) [Endozoicomonas sp. G2_2]
MAALKIVTVVGARPQFIKAATVSRAVAGRHDVKEIIVHTGQHYDANMSDVFFDELSIPKPNHHLNIGGGPHGQMTGRMLEAVEGVFIDEKPDWVLVYGDTNSTLAGALAAAKLHIPVAHVEAGLRSFNRKMPEEINRILTDHAADRLFAPTAEAVGHLRNEGIDTDKVRQVGDVMYDAALFYGERAARPDWFAATGLHADEFVLATVHRAENTDDPLRLEGIFRGLAESNTPVILPVHPRLRGKIGTLVEDLAEQVRMVDPVSYLEMTWLIQNCAKVATDSGGLQKEAWFHGKRCIVLRDETEWSELISSGWNILAGANSHLISKWIRESAPESQERSVDYGSGDAAGKIVAELMGCS